ncbi:LysR family transcriptional regulator [Fodinicurvata sp. EGI_FJ10296]|uniref:LysR substrate-binding domain-containing protein n=1 Tax=Fodinicurvata sp. EGI_FJ10296 TaxID=3231908 RepID=UPI003453F293
MRPITLQRLQVFCAVYERNAISAAARYLRLSQPTVSRHLRDFEAGLGVPLFTLDHGRITPTVEADTLYAESRFLGDGVARLEATVNALRKGTGTRLSIMCIGLLSHRHLPRALSRMFQAMPDVRLNVDIATAAQQIRAIRAGQVDLGLVAGTIDSPDLVTTRIGQGKLVVLVPVESPLAEKDAVTVGDLADHSGWIRMTSRGPIGRILNDVFVKEGISVDDQITAYSLMAIPQLAAELRRCVIVDEFTAAAAELADMKVVALASPIFFDIFALTPDRLGQRQAAEMLATEMRDLLGPG